MPCKLCIFARYFSLLTLQLASVPPSSLPFLKSSWDKRDRPEYSKGHETIHLESSAPSRHSPHHLSIPKCVTGVTLEPDTLWTRHRRFRRSHTQAHTLAVVPKCPCPTRALPCPTIPLLSSHTFVLLKLLLFLSPFLSVLEKKSYSKGRDITMTCAKVSLLLILV